MKKSLSLLIALAMVFGMFASMASAATTELTTAQKYQWFVDQGVLKGDPSGNPRLDSTLTRAEFATIVASVGGLKLVNTTSSFSDVKAKDWYFTAIQSASDAGLVNGIGAGKFGPKLNVTVEQVIKVAVTLAGIKPVDGAVVAGSSAWAGPYIQAATNAGLAVPSNYKANATRGQTIDVAYIVTQLKARPVLDGVTVTVNADDTITVAGKVVGTADSVKVAQGTATAVAATLKDDKTFTYTTAKQVAGTYKFTVVAYDGDKASAAVEKEVTIGGFAVSSVAVLNGKQIAVTFNKAVQEGTSVGGVSYSLNTANSYFVLSGAGNPKSVSLNSDKTVATLTFANFVNLLGSYQQFEVKSGLKSASGQAVTAYKQAVQLTDSAAPTVTEVTWLGTVPTIKFSEPVKAASLVNTVSINGSVINLNGSGIGYKNNADADGDVTSIDITGLSKNTSYTLNIVGAQDLAGTKFEYSTTLQVPNDTTPPTVVSATINGTILTVKYSEPLGKTTAGVVYGGVASASGKADVVGGNYDSSASTVTFDLNGWLNGANFLNSSVTISGYKDAVGNTGADYTTSVTITKDTTAPVLQTTFVDGNKVVFKFDEEVKVAGTPVLNASFTDTNGVKYAAGPLAGAWSVGYDANNNNNGIPSASEGENNYLVFNKSGSSFVAGTYTFTVKYASSAYIYDASANANKIASDLSSATVTVSSGSTASGKLRVAISAPKAGQLRFEFGYNDGTAGNPTLALGTPDISKFLINGVALPTGTSISFVENRYTIVADLPANSITSSGYRTVSVSNITDEAGNTLSTASGDISNGNVYIAENVKPTASNIAVVSDKVLTVSLSESVNTATANAANITGVEVYINGSTTKVANLTVTASGTTLRIEALSDNNVFAASQTIAVKFANAQIYDVNGNQIADVTLNK
ncbi:S-layer homology domain-containing protein [Cohnella hashimotonis]|uniref:S-layer homology domain-containing protein n=1 Tax=Cohnella hashimotonis TaxID=2826895 RepID=A0ABT6TTV6_9BACL|nr:S-layer homology domain-containing protein [Cohnella hashimotonis]MDI4650287.1 S-layer homology domain-containing protein [Cohnella hashimotonis]